MRFPIPLAVSLAALTTAPLLCGQQAALFDELTCLYPDSSLEGGVAALAGETPRGVPAGVHLLVSGLAPAAELRCGVRQGGRAVAAARIFQLLDVPVEQNTGLVSRTEAWDRKKNPFVIRRAPFRVFEALQPIDGAARAAESGVLALRVEVPIASGAAAGVHTYTIALAAGEWRAELRWKLRVVAVDVPPSSAASPGYTNWFSPDLIARRHGLEPWSEPFWKMLARYAELMARGRQNCFWIRWRDFLRKGSGGETTLDRGRFARYVRLFLALGFTRIEGGHLAHRHGGDWKSARLDLVTSGADARSERGRADLARLLGAVRAALAELHLPAGIEYLQHLSDEPTDTNAASYLALAREVRRLLPGVSIFEATMSLKLDEAIDQWCPQVQEYQRHRAFFEARKAAGDRVWVYTCLAPGGPWLNRLLDQERLRPLYLGWALVRYDLAGFLHWGLNHYRPGVDPLEQSVVPHGSGPPNYLPAGDSHVIYPGPAGPLSGQRFEAQRIGMEDAELLLRLRRRDPARAQRIIARVFRSFDEYEREVPAYRAARHELLEAQ